MKKTGLLLLLICLLMGCGKSETSESNWREQYDLGMRYLEEEQYEQAIIAFTEAIGMDPKQPEMYIARGRAYILSGETEEHLTLAQADYETVLGLDEMYAEAYLGLADLWIRRGEYEEALKILKKGLEKTGDNEEIADKIAEIESGNITDSENQIRRMSGYDGTGALSWYHDYFYDANGREYRAVSYTASGAQTGVGNKLYDEKGHCIQTYIYSAITGEIYGKLIYEHDADGNAIKLENYYKDGILDSYETYEYDLNGKIIRRNVYEDDGILRNYYINEYDANGNITKTSDYYPDGTLMGYSTFEYNEKGEMKQYNRYTDEGILEAYDVFEYDAEGNRIGVQEFYTGDPEMGEGQGNYTEGIN